MRRIHPIRTASVSTILLAACLAFVASSTRSDELGYTFTADTGVLSEEQFELIFEQERLMRNDPVLSGWVDQSRAFGYAREVQADLLGLEEEQAAHTVTYLHPKEPQLRDTIRTLREAAFTADRTAQWGVIGDPKDDRYTPEELQIRCIELIRYDATVSDSGLVGIGWHFDQGSLLSMSVILSDPEDYRGGDFHLGRPHKWPVRGRRQEMSRVFRPARRGTVHVWRSWKMHRVMPITRGTRVVLVVEWWPGGRPVYTPPPAVSKVPVLAKEAPEWEDARPMLINVSPTALKRYCRRITEVLDPLDVNMHVWCISTMLELHGGEPAAQKMLAREATVLGETRTSYDCLDTHVKYAMAHQELLILGYGRQHMRQSLKMIGRAIRCVAGRGLIAPKIEQISRKIWEVAGEMEFNIFVLQQDFPWVHPYWPLQSYWSVEPPVQHTPALWYSNNRDLEQCRLASS